MALPMQGTCTIEKIEETYIGSGLGYLSHRTAWRTTFHGGNLDGRTSTCTTRRQAREDAETFGYDWKASVTDRRATNAAEAERQLYDALARHDAKQP